MTTSSSDGGTSVFFNDQLRGFGAVSGSDERLQWAVCEQIDDPAPVEAEFLGFNVPERDILAAGYVWAHTNLKLVTGGAWAWQGAAQLSRAVESRPDKRPILSDLRESGQIEADADCVLMLYRGDYYDRESECPGEMEIIVRKNRQGRLGMITTEIDSRRRFRPA